MMLRHRLFAMALLLGLGGCATKQPAMDYTAYKQSNPKSILVMQPINHSTEVVAPYAVLSNVTIPLAEAGYYVFPVALVEETFKNNGLTVAQDIHSVPPSKLHDIFGADAGLFIQIEQYGTSYAVLSSDTVVKVKAELKDLRTGQLLWQGSASAASSEQNSGSNSGGVVGMLVEAAVNQIVETLTDKGFEISDIATQRLLTPASPVGILYGPRSPLYGKDQKGKGGNK